MFKLKSIRLKMLIIFLIESTIITLLIVFSSQYFFINTLKKSIDNNAKLIVDAYSQKVGSWIFERMNELSIYAGAPAIKTMNWDICEPYLKEQALIKKDYYLFLFISDLKGNYNTTLSRNAGNISDRTYFKKILKDGKIAISDPLTSKSTGKQIFVIGAPIKNEENETIGVIAAAIDLIKLYNWIGEFKIDHPNSYSYIINEQGLVITHPNKNLIMNLNLSLSNCEFDKNVLNKILSGKEGSVLYKFNKIKSFAYYKSIPFTNNWKIITKIPDDYLFVSVYDTRNKLLVISIFFILISGLFGLWFSNKISHPIIQLKNIFKAGINGNTDIRSEIKRDDEIGEASDCFNKMMDEYNVALNELKERKNQLQEYIDHLLAFNGKIDIDGNVLMINATSLKRLGITDENIVGKKIWDMEWFNLSENVRLNFIDRFSKVLNGEMIKTEEIFRNKDGDFSAFDFTFNPVFDTNNKIRYVVVEGHDVTEKIRLHNELLNAKKLESIGLLAGGIAHDFNNILTGILGMISLAKIYATDNDDLYDKLFMAEKATLKAKDLTGQLLTFSKGGLPVKKSTSIETLLIDSTNFISSGSNVKCNFFIDEDLYNVEVDEGQINQVINNIIINAIQAMPDGGNINIKAQNYTVTNKEKSLLLKNGNYVKISITDQGMGIPQDMLNKIFDPYFTTKKTGSGLGLATSYSIIRKHEGAILAESEVNVGTTFYIYLPATIKKEISKNHLDPGKKKRGGKILVMDDDKCVLDVTKAILRSFSFEVDFATNGLETIEKYKESLRGNKYDVVIIDLTIPGGMGGEETIKRLLEIDPNVKAIVSSGYSNAPIMSRYMDFGFKGVVAKPYIAGELIEAIDKVLT